MLGLVFFFSPILETLNNGITLNARNDVFTAYNLFMCYGLATDQHVMKRPRYVSK